MAKSDKSPGVRIVAVDRPALLSLGGCCALRHRGKAGETSVRSH